MVSWEQRQQVLQQVLTAVWITWGEEGYPAQVLSAQILEALTFLLVDEPHLLQQALVIARNIRYTDCLVEALSTLGTQLVDKHHLLLQQALTVAKNIHDKGRAKVLTTLALQLVGEPCQQVLQQALIAVKNIENEVSRTQALIALAPLLVEMTDLQKDFIALALSDREKRIFISARSIQNDSDLLTYTLWADWLEHAPLKRSELFDVTDKLCAAAIQLSGNPQEANEIARAVMDVAKWWP
ncbi:MAG: hypothetical protein HC877_13940 [Thioploca sp.]|nr:hypothetical protein [Thioploca sp.]